MTGLANKQGDNPMQTLAVILLVAVAAFFVLKRFVAMLKSGGNPCGCCSEKDTCGERQGRNETQLEDHRKDPSS
jgi:hypothetical protein